jgi:peroxiredoxin Q/BCP
VSKIEVGKTVPPFKLPATGNRLVELKSLRGKNVVIYFYPKDSTPGCTNEGCDFKVNYLKFKRCNTIVLGVSRDTLASHEKFKTKYDFPFDLLSDTDEKACSLFEVIKEKNMYGRKVLGIERSTFLIDKAGKLQKEWRKVRVKGHAEEVLDTVRSL